MDLKISQVPRPVRRRLKRVVQKDSDANYRRRAGAILLLFSGLSVTRVAAYLQASRTTIRHWRDLFESFGEAGLVPEKPGRRPWTIDHPLGARLLSLVQQSPSDYGFQRPRWTSEMLALQLQQEFQRDIHASTVRRLLPKLGVLWNRARPTLCLKDKTKVRKMRAIRQSLEQADAAHPVFYMDEVDIDFNPRIGPEWVIKGTQAAVPTPGKNIKRYLAGALNAQTGHVVYVEWEKKNSCLFLRLMAELRKRYRRARRIILIADNYSIHKSGIVEIFLKHNPKFTILFQPSYHPWVNHIERLWKQLHDNVTRNHRCSSIGELMDKVRDFIDSASPFPGTGTHRMKQ